MIRSDSILAPESGPAPESTRPARKRILLADDDDGIRESLGKLLRNAGYQVIPAAHGGQVLQLLLDEEFDLLLLDLNMPAVDGWQILEQIGHCKPLLPVIVITAQSHQADWMRERGARVLMEKPLDLPVLLQTVEQLIAEPKSLQPQARTNSRQNFRHYPSTSSELDLARCCRGWGTEDRDSRTGPQTTSLTADKQ